MAFQEIVHQFFTEGDAYDTEILQLLPVYEEMLANLLDHIWMDTTKPVSILELGCGTGNLSQLVAQTFPNASITLVDYSASMIEHAEEKLAKYSNSIQSVVSDFALLDFEPERFDLVISSLALHHLSDPQKAAFYQSMFSWLTPGGKFRCADQCMLLPKSRGFPHLIDRWKAWAKRNGGADETIERWLDHIHTADHYAPLKAHMMWMVGSGFVDVDCYWRNLFWTVFGATKPKYAHD